MKENNVCGISYEVENFLYVIKWNNPFSRFAVKEI